MQPEALPFWHPHTASVDWCEDNYAVSPYVVEFYNSLSSLAMIFFGEYGARTAIVANDPRLLRVFRLITVVGIGSVLFHATLKHTTQMMDELPMVWVMAYSTCCILQVAYGVMHRGLPWLFGFASALATIAVTATSGLMQFVTFHVIYETIQFTCIALIVHLYRQRRAQFPQATRLVVRGLQLFVLACTCWGLDTYCCHMVDGKHLSWLPLNVQLHAWWHVFVSLAFYYMSTFLVFDTQLRSNYRPYIRYHYYILPVVVLEPPSEAKKSPQAVR
ncbi:hypothetical protein H4R35_000102 [Dimargaris xerosporica]|nr:hypothetical protein H4R35_000102 [Dimargaris xerosporica]